VRGIIEMGADQSICCSKRGPDASTKADTRSISKNAAVRMPLPADRDDQRSAASTPPNKATQEKVGIGAYFQRSAADPTGLAVKSLLSGSPAQKCGKISVGDVVLSVNGEAVYGKKLAELAEVLLGPAGSKAALTFRSHRNGQEYTVEVERGIPGH